MREVGFVYDMQLTFDKPVRRHYFTLRCFPKSDLRQRIKSLEFKLSKADYISKDEDCFKNKLLNGEVLEEHSSFFVSVSGTANTGLEIFEEREKPFEAAIFSVQTELTRPGDMIKEYYGETVSRLKNKETDYDRALWLMRRLYSDMTYSSGATGVKTTAEQALSLGMGVCQDYTHIMLSLCRLAGIPSRYVVGMLEGEGESHAWAEILSNGRWYGLDPTNNLLVNESYIKISHGRDYSDCSVSRGVFLGSAKQSQKIRVVLEVK